MSRFLHCFDVGGVNLSAVKVVTDRNTPRSIVSLDAVTTLAMTSDDDPVIFREVRTMYILLGWFY